MDHHNCMEGIVVKGKPEEVKKLAESIKVVKGGKHSFLTMAITGKELV
ncbi:MAG: hypothetical protein SWO11_00585 [Thermodesulfobacteriota bacterium]|nr:hypothetical protein [Thermodesulfobacteriota bacterium]